ncbi:MAG: riboflavin synthase [Thermodesulfobacteriota bacterium]
MFTGIIEDVGAVKSIEKKGSSGRITVETSLDLSAIKEGDSIAVDGACLTVTGLGGGSFTADLSDETLRATTLSGLETGSRVNLEHAMTLAKPLGGHLVTGHVDGIGRVTSAVARQGSTDLEITAPEPLMPLVVLKGSVAVDGISLTVAGLTRTGFRVAVIPHTLDRTTLPLKKAGSRVNIETDIIGKYVDRLLRARSGGVTRDLLAEEGFIND